jgi:glycosyltransferase involved in cell wall biosynthesis
MSQPSSSVATLTPKLSVYVIAYNDEPNMRACLESAAWADELIVIDSHSTDATEQISREFTDRVFQHDFHGFGRLRNDAVAHASHDWVFSLDTDERITPELRREIEELLRRGPQAEAYFVPRKNYFLGRWIRQAGWYPNYRQPQLFRKDRMRYRDELVHEGFEVDGVVGHLKEHVIQYPFRDIDQYVTKMDRYADLMARRMADEGKQFRTHDLISHPVYTFLKMYGLQRGFRGGMPGLILATLYAYYTFVKYARLWELQRQRGSVDSAPPENAAMRLIASLIMPLMAAATLVTLP